MALPAILGGLSLGAKLLGGFFKHKSQQKQAQSIKADRDRFNRESMAAHNVDENRRVERGNAIQGLLQRVGGKLREGAPDYTFDPAVLARLQERRPYVAPMEGGDPTAGQGSAMFGDLASGAGSLGENLLAEYYRRQEAKKLGGAAPQVGGGLSAVTGPVYTPFNPKLGPRF